MQSLKLSRSATYNKSATKLKNSFHLFLLCGGCGEYKIKSCVELSEDQLDLTAIVM